MTTTKLSTLLSPAFRDVHKALKDGTANQFVLKGGRGSTKSSYVSVEFILQLLKHPELHGVVMRQVANTMRTTVFAQYLWSITELGLYDKFKATTSPMELTYKKTGQKIMFFGADDPGKLKSMKVPFGYTGLLHLEELDQFKGEEAVRNIEQSILRGGQIAIEWKTFNPPKTRLNWANKYCMKDKPMQLIHSSDYRSVPPEWLGERFINDAEYLKQINPKAYEHEYLGIPNGNGGNVFEFLEIREITDEEISQMDRIYNGCDWGWYPDQYAFLRTYYDSTREKIYLLDELYVNKWSNEQTAKWIKGKGYDDYVIICDSAEPKSIADYREFGLPARGAVKGPGSIEYGFKWLQKRTIVIDPERTPNAYKEFTDYEYERDKDGNVISGYPDGNDHAVSALRYAYNSVIMRGGSSA